MMKYVVCGNSVEDVQNGVEAMKMAIASGASCGVGGSTVEEVEQGLEAMRKMGANVVPSQMGGGCLRSPNGHCPYCEDEDEEADYQEGYMALDEDDEKLSSLCDTPEEPMVEAIIEGYDLDKIYICKVRVYDDDSVEVIDILYSPNE